MILDRLTRQGIPMPVAKVAAVVAIGAIVIGIAGLFTPDTSSATPAAQSQNSVDAPAVSRAAQVRYPALIGTVTGPTHQIDVLITRRGTAYTVRDSNGKTLATEITLDELRDRFPTLDPSTVTAEADLPDTELEEPLPARE